MPIHKLTAVLNKHKENRERMVVLRKAILYLGPTNKNAEHAKCRLSVQHDLQLEIAAITFDKELAYPLFVAVLEALEKEQAEIERKLSAIET